MYGFSSAAYAAAWGLSWQRVSGNGAERAPSGPGGALRTRVAGPAQWALGAAVLLHGLALFVPLSDSGPDFRFGFAQALSAALWLGVSLLWIEGFTVRVDALRLLVLPVAALAAWLPAFFPGGDVSRLAHRPLFLPHLTAAMLGYSVLTLAALHAVLMAFAERGLHPAARIAPWLRRWLDSLPPLLVLERMLFRLIVIGFVLLSLTVLTGVVFSEAVFGQALRWDHKTIFSLIAWAMFATLLLGRWLRGWRGRTALRFTLGGFALLLMSYAGTRFVLEVVLDRVA